MSMNSASTNDVNKAMHPKMKVYAELLVNEKAEAFVLHDKPFDQELSWFEYHLDTSRLEFIMEDGDVRDFGMKIDPQLSRYLQNAFQIQTVMVDKEAGVYEEEEFYPLIIHRD